MSGKSRDLIVRRGSEEEDVHDLLRSRERELEKTPVAAFQDQLEDLKQQIGELSSDLQSSISEGNEDQAGRLAAKLAFLTKQLRTHSKRHRDLLDMVSSMQLQLDRVRVDLRAECGRFHDIQSEMAPSDEKELRLKHEIEDGRTHVMRLSDELSTMPTSMRVFPELERMYASEYSDLLKANRRILAAYEFAAKTLDSLNQLKDIGLDE